MFSKILDKQKIHVSIFTFIFLWFLSISNVIANYYDDFNLPDNQIIGNDWIEKNPSAFSLSSGTVTKQSVTTGYRNNIVYRPDSENLLDVEVSLEFGISNTSPGYPQVFARVQTDTVQLYNYLDAYILYINNNVGQAILGRQRGSNFVATLATISLTPSLNTTDTFRMTLSATGASPVALTAIIERFNGTAWEIIGQTSVNDASSYLLGTSGSVGFGGYVESSYRFDNFRRVDLNEPLVNPIPTLSNISPNSALVSDSDFLLTVTGSDFLSNSTIRWNGADRTTVYISPTELQATIPAADISIVGTADVTVFTPAPGGGLSLAQTFTVNDVISNPVPGVTSMTPNSATVGGSDFLLTVTGSDFLSDSTIRWNGADRTTVYISPTELQATIPAADISVVGTADVTVFTPAPGGGESVSQQFVIDPGVVVIPTFSIESLEPNFVYAGTSGLTLTVFGNTFTPDNIVRWNGSDRVTTFISDTELQADITISDVANNGIASITVYSPIEGTSEPLTFIILDPASSFFSDSFNRPDSDVIGNDWTEKYPTAYSLQNGKVLGVRTVTETGANIVYRDNIVYRPDIEDIRDVEVSIDFIRQELGGNEFPQVHARVQRDTVELSNTLASYIFYVEDSRPLPGYLSIAINQANWGEGECIIGSIPLPSALIAGERYRLRFRITGAYPVSLTGYLDWFNGQSWELFAQGAVIHDDNTQPDPYYCGPGYVPAPISNAGAVGFSKWYTGNQVNDNFYWIDLSSSGGATNPTPSITSITPNSIVAGSPELILTVSGTDFIQGSVIRWNGEDRPTSYISSTELQGTISATDLINPGSISVSVFSPAPGGGDSNVLDFTISDSAENPVPAVSQLTPASVVVGTSDFTLTITGTGFTTDSVVRWNGIDRSTTYISDTQLLIPVTSIDVAVPGSASVEVFNPTPGGGVSNIQNFTILQEGNAFIDDFNRIDSNVLDNSWIEKSPTAFSIQDNLLVKQSVSTTYLDNIVYRPATEDVLDVEVSIELNLTAGTPGYPQIFTRVQSDTVGINYYLDGYILYINNSNTQAILGHQIGSSFVTTLSTINLSSALNTTDTFRLRLSTAGVDPVILNAYVERFNGISWDIIGETSYNDTSPNRITNAGSVGFGGYVEASYNYDNFIMQQIQP